MNAHSQICGPTTKHIVNPVARNLFRYEPLDESENWQELLEHINELLNVDFSVWKSSFTVEKLSELAPVGDIAALIKNIFYEEAKQHNKSHVFIKENQVYEFLPFSQWHFPEAKYVYQVRDPRDMALSWKKSSPHPGGVIRAARQWKKDQQQTLKNYSELKKQGRVLLLRYEDLISHTETELTRVLEFMGFSFEPEMLHFHEDGLTRQNSTQIKAWENLSKGVITDNKKKYVDQLSDKEIKYIEKICVHEMPYVEYELENNVADLQKISEEELAAFEAYEKETIVCRRPKGIKANMKAKERMYTKIS